MPSPNEKLAESLDVLEALQQDNQRVFRSDDLSRVHRERLVENGFLQEVMKGWLISSSPEARAGESTPWHASFWEFCARYCDERFGEQWHLSPEQSLFLHGERTVIPDQLVVHSPKATNNDINLLFGTTLYDLKVVEMPATAALMVRDGLRLFSPPAALVRVPESFFQLYPIETQVVMASLVDASELASASPERRPFCESRLSRQSLPPNRARRLRGRDSPRDEGRRIRCAREQSI